MVIIVCEIADWETGACFWKELNSVKNTLTGTIVVGLLAALSLGSAAQAQVVLTTGPAFHPFYVSTSPTHGNYDHVQDGGGNIGPGGSLDGTPLIAAYCVDLFNPVYTSSTYTTSMVTTDGTVFGNPVANAGSVAWLITNFGATATTPDEENALQGAIWRTLYGSNFEVDGADNAKAGNTSGMISAYQSYITALGANTAPVSSVDWISPAGGPPLPQGYTIAQGLVGLRAGASAAPEPGTLALLALGPIAGVAARRRRSK